MSGRLNVIGLSDALTMPTGFGRVARELFQRLPQDRLRLGYLARGWVGSGQFPGITCYSDGSAPGMCQNALPLAALDFAGQTDPFILWTLMDPWQTGWLSNPHTDPYATGTVRAFLEQHRHRIYWMAHFPIDGTGPDHSRPPLWTADHLAGAQMLIAMSTWGRDLLQPQVKREVRVIHHAVNTEVLRPMDRSAARQEVGLAYRVATARALAAMPKEQQPAGAQAFAEEVELNTFRLEDRFTVICCMANRSRKYWWDVLRAFHLLLETVPDARLIALCGDRRGVQPDSWPLEECCRALGLRLEDDGNDPNVTLIEQYVDRPGSPPDHSYALLLNAANVAVLLSGGEGFGLPQLEAHACGLPCIVGNYSASTELAVDGREMIGPRGFTTTTSNMVRRPVYSPKDLADRLIFAARNPAWCQEVGRKGVEQAQAHDWARILPQWEEVFAEAAVQIGQMKGDQADGVHVGAARPTHPLPTAG